MEEPAAHDGWTHVETQLARKCGMQIRGAATCNPADRVSETERLRDYSEIVVLSI